MRLVKLSFAICFLMSAFISKSQTSVAGGSVSGVWTLAGSPYNVQNSIMVADNTTLTIQPGVIVNFTGHYKLLVKGSLIAKGTSAGRINFTAANTVTGWYGIRIDSPTAGNDSTVISYCDLKYGKANGSNDDANGGAVFVKSFSKVRVDHCLMTNNYAFNSGGAIHMLQSGGLIVQNTFNGNKAEHENGGAISTNDSSPFIGYNAITTNTAWSGGGISCTGASTVNAGIIISNTIMANRADFGGGGILSSGMATLTISKNIVSQNDAGNYNGGGIYLTYVQNGEVSNNIITRNVGGVTGGGINCTAYKNLTISNNLIANNKVPTSGGAIQLALGYAQPVINGNVIVNNATTYTAGTGAGIDIYMNSAQFINNTIAHNLSAGNGGGISFSGNSDGMLKNNIIYGNMAPGNGKQILMVDEDSDPEFRFNNIEGAVAGFDLNGNFYTGVQANNINTNPQFLAPSTGTGILFAGDSAKWMLSAGNTCIDAGDPSGSYPAQDIAGNYRIMGNNIDMGAYEFLGPVGISENNLSKTVLVYPNPFGQNTNIRLEKTVTHVTISLYDLYGKKVSTRYYESGNNFKIEKESLAPGTYFFELSSENEPTPYKGKLLIME